MTYDITPYIQNIQKNNLIVKNIDKLVDLTNNFFLKNEVDPLINFWVQDYTYKFLSNPENYNLFDQELSIIQSYIEFIKNYNEITVKELFKLLKQRLEETRVNLLYKHIKDLNQSKYLLEFEYRQKLALISKLEELEIDNQADLHIVHEFGIFISSTLEIEPLLENIIDGINGILEPYNIFICLFNENNELIIRKIYTYSQNFPQEHVVVIKPQGFLDKFIKSAHNNPYKIEDITSNKDILEEFKENFFIVKGQVILSPLTIANELLGIIIVNLENELKAYDFIKVIVPYISSAIKNSILYQKINQAAIRDPLTNLYNRRHFQEQLEYHFEYSKRYKVPFSLLLIDIDNFKKINDTYGHKVGDFVIKNISSIILKNLRNTDIVARYGGEEFIVLLAQTPKKWSSLIANRLVKAVASDKFKFSNDLSLDVTISVGYSSYPDDSQNLDELIEIADKGLYIAKKSGKNQVGFFK